MKKTPKVIIATTLGAALLLGGSTYALWTSNVTPETNATIQTGGIGVETTNLGEWKDAINDVVIDPATFKAVPTDRLEFTQGINITADGTGDYTLSASQSAEAITAAQALVAKDIYMTIRFVDSDGVEYATQLPAVGAPGVFPTLDFSTTGVSLDEDLNVRFIFHFDGSEPNADDTKKVVTVVENTLLELNAK